MRLALKLNTSCCFNTPQLVDCYLMRRTTAPLRTYDLDYKQNLRRLAFSRGYSYRWFSIRTTISSEVVVCISRHTITRNNGLLSPCNINCSLLDMWELIRSMAPMNPILVKVGEHIKTGSSDATMITQEVIAMGVQEPLRVHMTVLMSKLGDRKWRSLWRHQ